MHRVPNFKASICMEIVSYEECQCLAGINKNKIDFIFILITPPFSLLHHVCSNGTPQHIHILL